MEIIPKRNKENSCNRVNRESPPKRIKSGVKWWLEEIKEGVDEEQRDLNWSLINSLVDCCISIFTCLFLLVSLSSCLFIHQHETDFSKPSIPLANRNTFIVSASKSQYTSNSFLFGCEGPGIHMSSKRKIGLRISLDPLLYSSCWVYHLIL